MGFETSCDETAVAILRKQSKSSKVEKKSEIIFSQISKPLLNDTPTSLSSFLSD